MLCFVYMVTKKTHHNAGANIHANQITAAAAKAMADKAAKAKADKAKALAAKKKSGHKNWFVQKSLKVPNWAWILIAAVILALVIGGFLSYKLGRSDKNDFD